MLRLTSKYLAFWRWLNIDSVFTATALMLLAGLLALSGVLNRLDALSFDLGRYLAFKPAPSDVVIVAIDEKSLSQIGRWPWSRRVHATLLDQLAKEKPLVIGLDIIFAEPDSTSLNAASDNNPDTDLQDAIKSAGNVVLPALFEIPFRGAPAKLSLPLAMFSEVSVGLGRVHVPLDDDGLARGIYLRESLQNVGDLSEKLNGFSQTHAYDMPFAAAILQIAGQLPATQASLLSVHQVNSNTDESTSQINREAFRLINFIGPHNHFQRISYSDVLVGHYPKNYFNHKIVLVGATAVGLGDVLPTSVSAQAQPMPGVEFHAHILEAMRMGKLIMPLPNVIVVIGSMLLAIVPIIWLRRLSPLQSLIANLLYFICIIFLVLLCAHLWQKWFPPASVLVAIILAYPLWSWRKLESAQGFLDDELEALKIELANIGADSRFLAATDSQDAMQSRISKVQQTAEKLRSLQHERNDTLAFISHDLRAPLGSAMMLMDDANDHQNIARARQMLQRAHAMAETFLQTSRAEMANQASFKPIELLSLVQQVQDEMYLDAKQKALQIKLVAHIPEVWVLGDFGLLQRAFANVLLNAIKYSPIQSVISIAFAVDILPSNTEVTVSITDTGHGIPKDKISRLFKRYSRAEGQHQSSSGTGLGLYFVQTVLAKHDGRVSVVSQVAHNTISKSESDSNQQENAIETFTIFKLTLPVMNASAFDEAL